MDYTGYKSIILDDKGLAQLYQEGTVDGLELYENEYLAVMNENEEVVDKFKMKNGELVQVPYTTVGMKSLEVMKPRNLEQAAGQSAARWQVSLGLLFTTGT